MALLAAPRTAPRTASSVSLSGQQRSDVISALYPLANGALQFQQLVSSAAFYLLIRTYFAASLIAAASLLASKSIAWRSFLVSRILVARMVALSRHVAWSLWDCKPSRRFRKRLEFELYTMLVGPGGNAVLLLIFWPGWTLAFLIWALWRFTG
ncbi:ABC transmembrane type-1 domain-containing protein [Madurella fahalii]|uniref:ABC transmembrane type-1 domain-containing protein n=1 Tax=Madurella fahalii TaxID=1157608 RepID=A0ABQ0GLI6_9PEZI